MKKEYLLIHKSILPDYFDCVLKCKELVEGKNYSVTDACKLCNISRSTYYKYKDYIFEVGDNYGHKVIISCKLIDQKGLLSQVLNTISKHRCNVITINQNIPINNVAHIILCIDTIESTTDVNSLIKEIGQVEGVMLAEALAVE